MSGTDKRGLFRPSPVCLSLHAHYLAQSADDLDQILLGFHHSIDRLVSHWSLVKYIRILAALHTSSGSDVVSDGEPALGFSAGHRASRAVAAAGKALRVSLAAHDVGTSSHAA